MVVCDGAATEGLAPVAKRLSAMVETLNADGSGSLAQAAEGQAAEFATADRTEDDLAAFLYTSGTTGRSKGAMLTQGNLLSNARTLAAVWRFTGGDVLLHALPIFHTHGLFVATNITLLAGGSMIFLPKFDLDAMIGLMPQATAMMGVPTFYTRLLSDRRLTADLTAHMRLFVSGSAPLLAETHEAFEARTGHRILERYGMTETNMNTSNPYDGDRRAGTVGFPLPGVDLKITDPATGEEVPRGEIGQIEVRGPNVFKGYWQMPEKTAAELRSDGFFITGDLGRIDADGYVHIVGRNKDLIISGGYNIYPKEIELILDAQPGVLESAVIGVPHADFGETVLGLIVPQPGKTPDLDAIAAAAAASLARFKQPRKLIVVDALPRNTMGKVQKNILRDCGHLRQWMNERLFPRAASLLRILVGVRGFEPPTPASRRQCSTRLSYTPTVPRGIAPTLCLCKGINRSRGAGRRARSGGRRAGCPRGTGRRGGRRGRRSATGCAGQVW
jgi:malonyl-CoA/methylmalonyl-CoA synthetase